MVAAANAGVKAPALETKFDRFASEEIVDTTEPPIARLFVVAPAANLPIAKVGVVGAVAPHAYKRKVTVVALGTFCNAVIRDKSS